MCSVAASKFFLYLQAIRETLEDERSHKIIERVVMERTIETKNKKIAIYHKLSSKKLKGGK